MSSTQNSPSRDIILVRQVALAATFTALVFLATSLFYLALVASSGFFNLGEAFVYLAALIGGPIVGAVAGGLGSAMADAFLGYGTFVPATLVLKGLEGFVAGLLYQYGKEGDPRLRRIILIGVTGFVILFSVYVTTPVLNGVPESVNVQGSFVFGDTEFPFSFPGLVLVIISIILSTIIWWIEFRLGSKGQMAVACIIAGPIIIVGYFLYEIMFLSIAPEAALSEVPFNIAQVVFGTLIAVPIVAYLKELGIIREP
ncbi:MAG: ECF transporter S component [Candidatus Thorarchaeota archaeon]